MIKVSAIIVAGGSSSRMGKDKIFLKLKGRETILYSLDAFEKNELIEEIILVVSEENMSRAKELCKGKYKKLKKIVTGGKTRGESVLNGINSAACQYVAIHDGARPLVSQKIITDCVESLNTYPASVAYTPVNDTVKSFRENFTVSTLDRSGMIFVQTPQCFKKDVYLDCIEKLKGQEFTDDCAIFENCSIPVKMVRGEETNIKLTRPSDILAAEAFLGGRDRLRTGSGVDFHRLTEGRKLILGGVEIPFEKGLLGHSDADVLTHAVMDSLLGAASLGDIGRLFPDSDPAYKDISSIKLLKKVGEVIKEAGYEIENIDCTILAQRPKLLPYEEEMRKNIAEALNMETERVSVKATTSEGMGFIGQGEGMASTAVCLLR